jgi:hypothetical protein
MNNWKFVIQDQGFYSTNVKLRSELPIPSQLPCYKGVDQVEEERLSLVFDSRIQTLAKRTERGN